MPERTPRLAIGAEIGQNEAGQSIVTDTESGTDITDHLIQGGLTVTEDAVYSDEGFINVLGETRRTLIGTSVRISARLNMVSEEKAEIIVNILRREKVGIVCADPAGCAVVCDRPEVTSELVFEDSYDIKTDGKLYYNISFGAGGIIPLDGL